jgi:hypothetical protein
MENHFSIAEAAAILQMTDAALLRACLDEQIELSIRFSGRNLPYGKLRRQLPIEAGYPVRRVKTASLGLYDRPYTLGGDRSLWTLVMAGSGRLCVEDEYQRAIGRIPAVSDSSPSSRLGVFVSSPDVSMDESGYVMLYELVEYQGTIPADAIRSDEDFHVAHTLPSGAELVISETALSAYRARRPAVEHQGATDVNTESPEKATESATTSATSGKPLSRQRHQEQEILRVLRELGYDPLALPKRINGKRWVAAEVRDKLVGPKWTPTIHKRAWERLRENGEIKEAR